MKVGAIAAGIAILAVAGGCSANGKASGSEGGGKKLNVIYVQGMTGNPFFTSVTCGAKAEAQAEGVNFSFQGGKDYSPESQTPVLSGVVARHPDGIIISPMAGEAMVPPLSQAKDAGIKLVFVDSKASDDSLAESFVSSDNLKGGQLAADKLGEMVGGHGKVMVMGATPGISTTDARQKGFEEEMKAKYPQIELLPTQFSQSTPAGATSKLSAVLAAHSDLAGVFAVSTQEVEGVATALKNASAVGKVKVVGFDTSDPIVEEIKSDVIQGVVVQEPLEMGKEAMQQMVAALKGQQTKKVINTPFVFLTKDTVNDPSVNKYIYKTSC